MRTLLLSIVLLAGCGGTGSNDAAVISDMAQAATGNHDLAGGGADMTGGGGGDMSLLPLASMCTMSSQCASGLCAPYKMGAYSLCTFACTKGAAAPMCTSPGNMMCNGMGYCMFPGM